MKVISPHPSPEKTINREIRVKSEGSESKENSIFISYNL